MTFAATTAEGEKIEWKMEIFHSQASDKHNESISGRRKEQLGKGTGLDRLIQVENAQKFIVQKKFFLFFSFLAKQREGKRKEKLPPARWLLLFAVEGAVCSWAWQ